MSKAQPERAPTSRDQQREATRARVIEAARALFAERGYDETTIRDIAQRAGIAPGSVFTTFESKADLLQEIIYGQYESLAEDLRALQPAGATLAAKLTEVFKAVYAFEAKHLRLLAEIAGASWTWSPAQEQENRRRIAVARHFMDRLLREGLESGELRADVDLDLVSDMIFSCYLRNFRFALFDGWDAERLAERLGRQIEVIFAGAQAPKTARES